MARQSRAPVILLTRPLAQSLRFATDLKALGPVKIVVSPLMATAYMTPDLPAGPVGALILTSESAVEAARRISAAGQTLPHRAYCVGDKTAAAARSAGFDAISARGDSAALIAMVSTVPDPGVLLHLRGADSTGDVAETLTSAGIVTHSIVVYDQRPQPLSAEASALFCQDTPVLIPIFSPRSAQLLAKARPAGATAPVWVVAMSATVADAAAALAPEQVVIAARPEAAAMLESVRDLLAAHSKA